MRDISPLEAGKQIKWRLLLEPRKRLVSSCRQGDQQGAGGSEGPTALG